MESWLFGGHTVAGAPGIPPPAARHTTSLGGIKIRLTSQMTGISSSCTTTRQTNLHVPCWRASSMLENMISRKPIVYMLGDQMAQHNCDEAAVVVRISTESFLADSTAYLRNWTTAAMM